ncbi:hypothetical protein B0H13DRAFT_2229261 [Mycena leptocephala]|nr:hypothetical protein B0H13DRAFT_2229261 [Mycena leptocephala]
MFPTVHNDFDRYKKERAALISHDRSLRADYAQVLSETEVKANRVVREIRVAEVASIWGAKHPDIAIHFQASSFARLCMEFLTGRSIIMPKGALLHVHLDATINAGFLLRLALEQPALHVQLRLSQNNVTESAPGLTDGIRSEQMGAVRTARDNFDATLGGSEGVLSINPTEAYNTHNTVDKGIIYFTPVWRKYIYEFLRSSVDDGISYIEARLVYMVGETGEQDVPHREWLLIFDEVQNELKAELKRQGREDEFIGARIIYTTLRFITAEELDWYCEDCISLKKEFPHLIAGFDLAGPENILLPLIDYAEGLLRFRKRQREAGVDIPLILHAGETCGDGTHADMNLYDAILLGSQRIGHGFSLVKHPKLMEACKEKGILIEVCLYPPHIVHAHAPLPILLNNGIPVAISSDDPAYSGTWVLVSSEITGLTTLRLIAGIV